MCNEVEDVESGKKEEANGRWRRRRLHGRVCGPERVVASIPVEFR